ncbi:ArsR/SmtB family transcription factor [Kitasatospora sp. NPDC003701]
MAADQLSRAFVALADPTRRDIVARLSVRDAGVGELAESYAMSMQAVSKHLKVLEEAGLVSRSRDAQRRPCHLEPRVLDLMTVWIERYRRQAEERFDRLDAVLAAMDGERDETDPRDETGGRDRTDAQDRTDARNETGERPGSTGPDAPEQNEGATS